MSVDDLAPVALFAFNRPEHTRQTLEALAANDLAPETRLTVFLDGSRDEEDEKNRLRILSLLREETRFGSVNVVEREENFGLTRNIIGGVTQMLSLRDRVIVVEDDIITSPTFLRYMNNALSRYESEYKVWHISGYTEPLNSNRSTDAYFSRVMNCWGWGTWKDKWQSFEKNPEKLVSEFTPEMIEDFNLNVNERFWSQVLANVDGRLNTWAIFWYATIFKQGGLCLNPYVSFVRNIGFDGTGVHCGNDEIRSRETVLNTESHIAFPDDVEESRDGLHLLQEYFRSRRKKPKKISKLSSLRKRLKKYVLGAFART
ncbi:glycosyltransferase family 2 protein [Roseibium sp.]|uniref:glycosyltransferase family 2 protein n=1 Tax=Roseibium sp. TaxID=1936156 RepID=UPI003D142ED5